MVYLELGRLPAFIGETCFALRNQRSSEGPRRPQIRFERESLPVLRDKSFTLAENDHRWLFNRQAFALPVFRRVAAVNLPSHGDLAVVAGCDPVFSLGAAAQCRHLDGEATSERRIVKAGRLKRLSVYLAMSVTGRNATALALPVSRHS
jgi:hypothetical protein